MENSKQYDLEDRTLEFSRKVRIFVSKLPKTMANYQDIPQLVRSSGSVGANYIEANEALSKKDFINRIKISRKEAKESRYWLTLVSCGNDKDLNSTRATLIRESTELMKIMSAIMRKSI